MKRVERPLLGWPGRTAEPVLARLPPTRRLVPPATEAPCRLISGDNELGLAALGAEHGPCVTLAYLDPPFLTGREHVHTQRSVDTGTGEVTRTSSAAFDDRWATMGDYLSALEPRLRLVRELLLDHGSMVLHVDSKTSHYAKVLCDELFGPECFASEVIWRYRRWPSKTKNFQRVHDVMLRYVRSAAVAPRFNQLYEPLAASTLATWGDKQQRAVTDKTGRRVRSSTTEQPSQGTPLGDVWEIGIIAPVARERTGYPTQKPEALLARWIEACSEPGDLVLDPYMGSGTSLLAACRRGRKAIGMDVGVEALRVTKERLTSAGIAYTEQWLERALAKTQPSRPVPTRAAL